MQLFLLTALTMTAFAANSVLNRFAVAGWGSDPGAFAIVRVAAGAVMLAVLVLGQGKRLPVIRRRRLVGAAALSLYMVGFSLAYLTLDAGLGALILFGVVQITMFGWTATNGAPPTQRQLLGAVLAFAGLVWVLWPAGALRVDPGGAALMASAGFGWAIYTLSGRAEPDALAATGANFVAALPVTACAILLMGAPLTLTLPGAALAVLSGAVTSGLGYALWYRILPNLGAARAATVQLSAPVIAVFGGVILLGEAVPLRLLLGGTVLLGGIALSIRRTPSG
ncbi:DMT family transporter [Ruegeria marina]|uniref:EamA-like transporter family protein n=1 Tax=Ruegeria marina TaxID=639004 RepID=A0A1G6RNQ1_9RHOB|nr:DMT family transporter [Ruegeria marina]SDD06051.1 EamA-like transporter family protein [Ruegeria marina]